MCGGEFKTKREQLQAEYAEADNTVEAWHHIKEAWALYDDKPKPDGPSTLDLFGAEQN